MEISTAHGYPIIFKAETWFGKLIWSLIFLGAIAAFVRQTYYLMDRYFEYPVTVEVSIEIQKVQLNVMLLPNTIKRKAHIISMSNISYSNTLQSVA